MDSESTRLHSLKIPIIINNQIFVAQLRGESGDFHWVDEVLEALFT
jgi:hypothetical protein